MTTTSGAGGAFTLAPGDIMVGENPAKVADALARFRPRVVTTSEDFDLGYRLLDAQFGPINEIERRDVLERWFVEGSLSPAGDAIRARYHMLLVEDEDGRVAGVRDCFTSFDPSVPRVVTLMSHSLVFPDWRRTGVAAILRASPVFFARRHAALEGCADPEILLVSEMEHIVPGDPSTLVRLFAYVRAGFRIVPPWLVPYAQPDFRDVEALGIAAQPIPFMLLVRHVGYEQEPLITWDRVQALFDGLQAIHGPSAWRPQLADIRRVALAQRDHAPGAAIPLYTPDVRRAADVAPLLRSVLAPHYPDPWHGAVPVGDPDADRLALETQLSSAQG